MATDRTPKAPPLHNGDRLTAGDFRRRYSTMPDLKKAELVEGVVFMHPLTTDDHGQAHFDMVGWLGFYRAGTPNLIGSCSGSVRLDPRNEFQPDGLLRLSEVCGGRARRDEDGCVEGPPELVVEVAYSGVSNDLHDKFQVYRRAGVREYVVWRLEEGVIDWFVERDGRYERLNPQRDGLIRSEVFPGLWLDPVAMIRGELRRIWDAVQIGLASPEHEAFLVKLLRMGEPRRG